MFYSSPEPQFVRDSAILEEKITLQWPDREAVDDFPSGKSPSVAVPLVRT